MPATEPEPRTYDVVIVGAGTAGCVTAARLVEAGLEVAVVEAGGGADLPVVRETARALEIPFTDLDWRYLSVPQPRLADRPIPCAGGRLLGGSSSINNAIFNRGARADYETWAGAGGEWWSWERALGRLRALEDFDRGESELRGSGGPLRVTSEYERTPVMRAFVEAAQAAGLAHNPDFNSGELDGAGYLQFNMRDGLRESAWSALLQPLAEAPNLTVLTGSRALRLSFDGHRCSGVEVARDGQVVKLEASREVVVAAGALATPQLLMLSGIGPAQHLDAVGVEPLVDAPAVGSNLQDHMLAVLTHAAPAPLPAPGPLLPPYQAGAFARTEAAGEVPDVQYQAVQVPFVPGATGMPDHGFTLMAILNQPRSRGSVRLASADPLAAPLIDPAYLSEHGDAVNLAAGLEIGRRILAAEPLAEWLGEEIFPGPAVADLEADVVLNSWSFYHPTSSCAFGAGEDSALDPQLRVRGTEGLRVADASALPTIPAGNTHVPTLMVGERAANAILGTG